MSDLVARYDEARRLIRRREGRELSPKEFLDAVSPGKRTKKSARDYIRRIRKGERSGNVLQKRALQDSGKTVRVDYQVGTYVDAATGEVLPDIRSQNVTIPVGKSRLDFYRANLRKAVNKGLRESWSRRKDNPGDSGERGGPLYRLPKDAEFVKAHTNRRTKAKAVILKVAS